MGLNRIKNILFLTFLTLVFPSLLANEYLRKDLKKSDVLNFEGIEPFSKRQEFTFLTLDGFRITADFEKTTGKAITTVVIFPDIHDASFEAVYLLKLKLLPTHNVVILFPRGHRNSEYKLGKFYTSKGILTGKNEALMFKYDYKAILEILQDRKKELALETDKIIFIMGRFHSSLALTGLISNINGIVLLSPNLHFYNVDTPDFAEKVNIPVLLLSDKYREEELKPLTAKFQKDKIKAVFTEKSGPGFSSILKKPDLILMIKEFSDSF